MGEFLNIKRSGKMCGFESNRNIVSGRSIALNTKVCVARSKKWNTLRHNESKAVSLKLLPLVMLVCN